jgi:hypothetical protein
MNILAWFLFSFFPVSILLSRFLFSHRFLAPLFISTVVVVVVAAATVIAASNVRTSPCTIIRTLPLVLRDRPPRLLVAPLPSIPCD